MLYHSFHDCYAVSLLICFPLFFISPKLEKCYRFFDIFFDSSLLTAKKITVVSRIYTIIVEIQNY